MRATTYKQRVNWMRMATWAKAAACLSCVLGLTAAADAQLLFVGLEGSSPATRSSDLAGFPAVTWNDHFAFDVSGAAAAPDGTLYLCNGSFTTKLYQSTNLTPPVYLATLSVDIHGMGFGRGKLYGYSNFADPKGIYEIDIATGVCKLVLDVYTGTSFRFFAFDYNPVDDLFYGYTEYGASGLYSINIDTGVMTKLAGSIPASNGQGRGMAIGNNTVYLTATRGDDGIPYFAYDLSQGAGGTWVPFTQPYPNYHSTGGAAWISPDVLIGDLNCDGEVDFGDINPFVQRLTDPVGYFAAFPDCPDANGDINQDGKVDFADINPFVQLLTTP